jgi:hypothetical protein
VNKKHFLYLSAQFGAAAGGDGGGSAIAAAAAAATPLHGMTSSIPATNMAVADDNDFPLGEAAQGAACGLGDGASCEACQ